MLVLAIAALIGFACGSGSLKRVGETCNASSECDPGLLCDLTTRQCAGMSSLVDAPVIEEVDGAVPDDSGVDARPDARPLDAAIDAAVDAPPDAAPDAL